MARTSKIGNNVSKVEGFVASNESPALGRLKFKFASQVRLGRADSVKLVYRCYNPKCGDVVESYKKEFFQGSSTVAGPFDFPVNGKFDGKVTRKCSCCGMTCLPEIYIPKEKGEDVKAGNMEVDMAVMEAFNAEHQ